MSKCSLNELYLVEIEVQFNIKDNPLQVTSTEKFTRLVRTDGGDQMARIIAKKHIERNTPNHLDCVFNSVTVHGELM